MAQIDLDLTLRKPGLLSVIIATHFSDLNVFLNLRNRETNKLVAIDKSYMLDTVEAS